MMGRSHLLKNVCKERFDLNYVTMCTTVFHSVMERTENIISLDLYNLLVVPISHYKDNMKQTKSITRKHQVKIGSRSECYCHTHSLILTTYVASPTIGGSSHKK